MAHPGGRPTKYTDDMVEQVGVYIDYRLSKRKLPTKCGLAIHLDVSKGALYDWAEEHPKFLHALTRLMNWQESELLDNGLDENWNSTITKLMLANNHGYRDRKDVTSGDEKIETVEVFKIPDNERG